MKRHNRKINFMNQISNDLAAGFALVPDVLDEATTQFLIENLAPLQIENAAGVRNLLDVPAIVDLARSPSVRALIEPILGPHCFAVRGIYFDKTPGANWKVPYHQDLSIAVRERHEAAGFGPWSVKAGVVHVQPPTEVLQEMVTLRLHLDDCDENNGALRVLENTHRLGQLSALQIARQREIGTEIVCSCARGGALLMRPLLLHASSPARSPRHRRVVHLEWTARELPGLLNWRDRIANLSAI